MIFETLGVGGLGVALLSFGTLALKVYAWRRRARDLREHARLIASAKTEQQMEALRANPPPALPDAWMKILVGALLTGLGLASLPVFLRAADARCLPFDCRPPAYCAGGICQQEAKPPAPAPQPAAPAPSGNGQAARPRDEAAGPRSGYARVPWAETLPGRWSPFLHEEEGP